MFPWRSGMNILHPAVRVRWGGGRCHFETIDFLEDISYNRNGSGCTERLRPGFGDRRVFAAII